jgi:RNA polymerase sigma-70 factor (ECF subfamily)
MEPRGGPRRVRGVRNDAALELAQLYATAGPRLVGYLTVLTGSADDAEEIAQDAFAQALRHWSKVRDYDQPTAWLYRVATRLAISRGRRATVARRGLTRLRAVPQDRVEHPVDDRVDLDAALATLPVEQRAVLLLHHVHDLPVKEVARRLGIAEGTVKSRLARARAALHPLLDRPGARHD